MLLKLKCKIGDDIKETLINRESINCVVPFGNFTHVYVNNIATPLEAHVDFKTLEGFLSSAFHEGIAIQKQQQLNVES